MIWVQNSSEHDLFQISPKWKVPRKSVSRRCRVPGSRLGAEGKSSLEAETLGRWGPLEALLTMPREICPLQSLKSTVHLSIARRAMSPSPELHAWHHHKRAPRKTRPPFYMPLSCKRDAEMQLRFPRNRERILEYMVPFVSGHFHCSTRECSPFNQQINQESFSHYEAFMNHYLDQGWASFLGKGLDGQYFQPYRVCYSYSTCGMKQESSHRLHINKWTWLCANKTLWKITSRGPDWPRAVVCWPLTLQHPQQTSHLLLGCAHLCIIPKFCLWPCPTPLAISTSTLNFPSPRFPIQCLLRVRSQQTFTSLKEHMPISPETNEYLFPPFLVQKDLIFLNNPNLGVIYYPYDIYDHIMFCLGVLC